MRSRGIVVRRPLPTERARQPLPIYRVNAPSPQVNVSLARLRNVPAAVASNAANRSTEEHRRSLVQATVFQSVDQLLVKLPTAALLVDWDLKPVCWNAAAVHFCTDRAYSAGSVDGKCRATGHSISALTRPHEIIASCESMRNRRRLRDHSTPRLVARASVNGRRSQNLDWRASIAMIFFEITPPGRPMFLIEIEAQAILP